MKPFMKPFMKPLHRGGLPRPSASQLQRRGVLVHEALHEAPSSRPLQLWGPKEEDGLLSARGAPPPSSAFMKPSMKPPEPSEGEDGGERGDGAPRSPPQRSSGSSSLGSWEAPREEALLGLTRSGASRAPQAPLLGEPPSSSTEAPLPPSEKTEGGVGVGGSVFPVRSPRHFSRSRAPLTLSHLPRGLSELGGPRRPSVLRGLIELRGPLVLGGLVERVSLEGSGAIRLLPLWGPHGPHGLIGRASLGLIGDSEVEGDRGRGAVDPDGSPDERPHPSSWKLS